MSAGQGNSAVLIVEDEPVVRLLLNALLQRQGLSTLTAEDGVQALEVYEAQPEKIGVVITDLNMPRMDGFGLIRRLTETSRPPAIIVTSGLPEMIQEVRRIWGDTVVVMPKPYDAKDVAMALQKVGAAATTHA